MLGLVWRVLAAAVALTVVQGAAARLVDALLGPSGVALPPGALGWVMLSNLLTAAMLAWLAAWSRLTGMRLAGALAVVLFGTYTFNNQIEALFFHVYGVAEFVRYVLQGALIAAAFAPILVFIMGHQTSSVPARASAPAGPPGPWRLAAVDVLYIACYLGAGTVIYPWVREFYEGRDKPAQLLIAAMQLFVRGPIFIALTLLVVRMIGGERWQGAVVAGATLSVVGGIAPLLIPNPYLPDVVRCAHLFEVGVSNFVFGAAAAWLLTPPPRPVAALAASSR